jgi:hypothetical protein
MCKILFRRLLGIKQGRHYDNTLRPEARLLNLKGSVPIIVKT